MGSVTVSVLVPLSSGDEARAEVWRWVRRRYEDEHADWEIVVGFHRTGVDWSKGCALADAASRAGGDLFVVADADAYVEADVLEQAVDYVTGGAEAAPWAMPHNLVIRLTRWGTARLTTGQIRTADAMGRNDVRWRHDAPAGGGIAVLTREAWDTVGGVDPRFMGWGGDDIAFGWALDTLVGAHVNLGEPLVHLWHPEHLQRRRSPNDELAGRYLAANGDPDAMRILVAEARDSGGPATTTAQ